MEKPSGAENRVRVPKAVFDGLEAIRQSGATNMLDRPVVIHLAREWDFPATADWIERIDPEAYGRLIFQGPEVVEEDEPATSIQDDAPIESFPRAQPPEELDRSQREIAHERLNLIILALGKRAALTIADTYETEQMGVLIDQSHRLRINAARSLLIANLIEASNTGLQLEDLMREIEDGIELLQSLIDPENM